MEPEESSLFGLARRLAPDTKRWEECARHFLEASAPRLPPKDAELWLAGKNHTFVSVTITRLLEGGMKKEEIAGVIRLIFSE